MKSHGISAKGSDTGLEFCPMAHYKFYVTQQKFSEVEYCYYQNYRQKFFNKGALRLFRRLNILKFCKNSTDL